MAGGASAGGGLSRRDFLKMSGLAGAALLGAGCSDIVSGNGIRIASWNIAADALDETVPSFESKYPEVSANVQYTADDYSQIVPRLQAGVGVPDVFSLAQQDFQNFLMRFPDAFVDLTERMAPREGEFAAAPYATVVKEGRVFGVPWDMGPDAMFYRKDLFEEAGIDAESLTTYDRYIEAGRTLQERLPGVKMLGFDATGGGGNPSYYYMLLNQQGGGFYDDRGRIRFTGEESIRAASMLKRFMDEGIAFDTAGVLEDWLRAVSNGDVATCLEAVWTAGSLRSQVADQAGKWGVVPLPAFEEGGSRQATAFGSVLVVSSMSRYKEESWRFIENALLTKQGQDKQWEYGLFPSWKPYWSSGVFDEPDDYFGFPVVRLFADVAQNVEPLYYGPRFLDFQNPMMDAYSAVLTSGADPREAYARAEEQAARASGLEVSA